MNKLILLSGGTKRPGWVTLDANPRHGADILAIIPPLPTAVTERKWEWEEIELVHGITSFYPWEASDLLNQIVEVLKPGGKLSLEQPDVEYAARAFLGGGPISWLFGDPDLRESLHMNKWGYSPESLRVLLSAHGFRDIRLLRAQQHRPDRDFRIEALK